MSDTLDMVKDLRDEFAMKALGGYMAFGGWDPKGEIAGVEGKTPAESLADNCYILADAMLSARAK